MNFEPDTEYWVFAYGSLIWNPGFPHVRAERARLHGFHRRFCLYSVRYRGTVDYPGLVLGLDRGGSCWGRAFQVTAEDWPEALAYLDEREIMMNSYHRRNVSLALPDHGRRVRAITYVVNRDNDRYARTIERQELITRLASAIGPNGTNRQYLDETRDSLKAINIRDAYLDRLCAEVAAFNATD